MAASETSDTLGDALPREIKRVRDLLPDYYEVAKIAPMTRITIMLMEGSLDAAVKALAEGDTVAMIRCYQDLKEYEA